MIGGFCYKDKFDARTEGLGVGIGSPFKTAFDFFCGFFVIELGRIDIFQ